MEPDISKDIEDYWNEYRILQETKLLDDYLDEVEDFGPRSYEDGEQEAEWLVAAGLSHLSTAYRDGRELADSDVDPTLRQLPQHQAEAVRRRVRTLNLTVRSRGQQRHHKTRHHKPDIREVFRDLESSSTGTRSRSATPNSLDSDCQILIKEPVVQKLPSAPLQPELFRRSPRNMADVASHSGDGVRILGYQRLGTLHLPRPKERQRCSSAPTSHDSQPPHHNVSTVHHMDPLTQRTAALAVLEERKHSIGNTTPAVCILGHTRIEYLGDSDVLKLQNLLLMEVTALLDSVNVPFHKRKTRKRRAKKEGSVFGVALTTLLEKDRELAGASCRVPLIVQKLLSHLEYNGIKEEGILRLSGSKHKVEALVEELENEMYTRPEQVDQLLHRVSCHDAVDVLKRLIRELPTPLFTAELVDMFYQTHLLHDDWIQKRALNLLVLMLPEECRNTLRALFKFYARVSQFEYCNRMTLANVAMIVAPSLFNPGYMRVVKSSAENQVQMALTCCQLTEAMLECGDALWVVPDELVGQMRLGNDQERYRKGHKENSKPMKRLLGQKSGEPIARKIHNEVDFQDGVVRINAPQFGLVDEPVRLVDTMKASDVVLRIVEEATKGSDLSPTILKFSRRSRFHIKSRALIELAPNGSFNCFLATGDPEMTLQTHYLYEIGGNIGQRQLEHDAIVLAVYKENPNAKWVVKCHHRTGHNSTPAT